jgi:hypothetical protein
MNNILVNRVKEDTFLVTELETGNSFKLIKVSEGTYQIFAHESNEPIEDHRQLVDMLGEVCEFCDKVDVLVHEPRTLQ